MRNPIPGGQPRREGQRGVIVSNPIDSGRDHTERQRGQNYRDVQDCVLDGARI